MTNFPDFAQQAADAIDALGDSPTPDEARRVTDRYEDTDLLAALVSRGGGGGGGGASVVSCVIARDSTGPDIHDVGDHPVLWDALYDNYWDFNTLGSIPTGLGLDFDFDGSSANITTTAAGVWSFTYNFTKPGDNDWVGKFDTRLGQQDIRPGSAGVSMLITQTVALPSGIMFGPQFSTTTQAASDPLEVSGGIYLIATRLG